MLITFAGFQVKKTYFSLLYIIQNKIANASIEFGFIEQNQLSWKKFMMCSKP